MRFNKYLCYAHVNLNPPYEIVPQYDLLINSVYLPEVVAFICTCWK